MIFRRFPEKTPGARSKHGVFRRCDENTPLCDMATRTIEATVETIHLPSRGNGFNNDGLDLAERGMLTPMPAMQSSEIRNRLPPATGHEIRNASADERESQETDDTTPENIEPDRGKVSYYCSDHHY